MLEKELVIEPVIRWASTSNVTVNVKVQSFEVTVQVKLLSLLGCIIHLYIYGLVVH
jgi:hypothetical protein